MSTELNDKLTPEIERSLRLIVWATHIHRLNAWHKFKKYEPKVVKRYGAKNFKRKGDVWFVFDREIVHTAKRRNEILAEHEKEYGGNRAVYSRISRKYVGISREDIRKRHRVEERRQLKAEKQVPAANNRTFIVAPRPGSFEADITFYRGQKIAVFGVVDQFSGWCHYTVLPSKKAKDTIVGVKAAFREFERVAPHHHIYKLQTDGGKEFLGFFKRYVEAYRPPAYRKELKAAPKKYKMTYRAIAQPQRMIENLNGTLRKYVERREYGRVSELKNIVRDFVIQKNQSIHRRTGEVPLDLLKLNTKELLKTEYKRQLDLGHKRIRVRGTKFAKNPKVGDFVRLYTFPNDKKKVGHRGPDPQWTKEIYVVKSKLGSNRGNVRFKVADSKGKAVPGYFFRDRLLLIEPPKHFRKKKEKESVAIDKVLKADAPAKLAWKVAPKKDTASDVKAKPKPKRGHRHLLYKFVFIRWGGEEHHEPAVVLEEFGDYVILFFEEGESILALNKKDITRTTNRKRSEPWCKSRLMRYARHVKTEKRRVSTK